MFNECRHILPSGYKCRAAALRGQAYCYFHTAFRRRGESPGPPDKEPVPLPSIEDTRGIQIAVTQLIEGLSSRRLDPASARLYLSALRLAERVAVRPEEKPSQTVRALCHEKGGDVLAPEESGCEPHDDCVNCDRRGICKDFSLYEDEVEELESRMQEEDEEEEDDDDD